MTEIAREEAGQKRWLKGLAVAWRAFAGVMGGGGLGLLAGLGYGAWVASHPAGVPPADEFLTTITWVICLALYGAIGLVIGLAVGLLAMLLVWIARLARRIAQGREGSRTTP